MARSASSRPRHPSSRPLRGPLPRLEADGRRQWHRASNDYALEWNHDATLSVPGGWEATSWRGGILSWHDGHFNWNDRHSVWVSVGAGPALAATVGEGQGMSAQLTAGGVGPIATGTVPVGVILDAPIGYHIAVEVTCTPTVAVAAITRWQQRTY